MAILVVLMAFAAAIFSYASFFPGASNFRSGNWIPGPAFFPQLLAAVMFLAAGFELIKAIRGKAASPAPGAADGGRDIEPAKAGTFSGWMTDWGTQNAIIILALMFAFPFLLERVGFALMGFLVVFVITWRLKAGLVKSVLFSAVAVTLTMFFFKYVFYMDFPFGIWSPTQYFEY
ncbi:MAG: tripartite tricarboxylate transporter TctB family protein [Planctomycetota bacterium]|jgi:hypothetical protein|nr:tripartite tricarboxylate transporter TctB family protein [Planctomycetota bacterium]